MPCFPQEVRCSFYFMPDKCVSLIERGIHTMYTYFIDFQIEVVLWMGLKLYYDLNRCHVDLLFVNCLYQYMLNWSKVNWQWKKYFSKFCTNPVIEEKLFNNYTQWIRTNILYFILVLFYGHNQNLGVSLNKTKYRCNCYDPMWLDHVHLKPHMNGPPHVKDPFASFNRTKFRHNLPQTIRWLQQFIKPIWKAIS